MQALFCCNIGDFMKTFLKEQSYNMVKLFLNQIALTVFGTVLTLSTSKNNSLLLAASIFSIIFFLALNYTSCWDIGAKDKIRVDSGRAKAMPSKGFLIVLGANIPNLILAILNLLGIIINTEGSQGMSVFCNMLLRLLNGMYLGAVSLLEKAVAANGISIGSWIFFVTIIPTLFVGWLAYYLGSKNIRIFGFLKPTSTGGNNK